MITTVQNFYFSVVPLNLPSSRHCRSEDDNNQPSMHYFMFIRNTDDESSDQSSKQASDVSIECGTVESRRNVHKEQLDTKAMCFYQVADLFIYSAVPPYLLSNGQSRSAYDDNQPSIPIDDQLNGQHRSADDDDQSNMHSAVAEQFAAIARGNVREEELDFIGNDDHRQHRSADDEDQSNMHSAVAEQLAAIATNEKMPVHEDEEDGDADADNNDGDDDNHDNGQDNRSDSDYHGDDDSIGNDKDDHQQHRSADDIHYFMLSGNLQATTVTPIGVTLPTIVAARAAVTATATATGRAITIAVTTIGVTVITIVMTTPLGTGSKI